MKKYYQLLLVILSIISFTILLMYKSENNRLKYVLRVVNFFGRKDSEALLHLEEKEIDNVYGPTLPLPVWSSIGDGFHIYAAYWQLRKVFRDTSLQGITEAFGMVIGPMKTNIDYKCYFKYNERRTIKGRFKFKPIDRKHLKDFNTYWFLCTLVTREFEMPESVIFEEIGSKGAEHEIRLRHVKSKLRYEQNLTSKRSNLLTICLNMFKGAELSPSGFINQNNLLQFFVSHKQIGVNQFSIYNGDAIAANLRLILYNLGLNIHYYPFNFPYALKNISENHQIRQIIENDCIIRNSNNFEYSLLLNPNEFVFIKTILDDNSFNTSSLSDQLLRFEIPSYAVCLDKENKFLIDNNLYNPKVHFGYKLFMYRTQGYVLPSIMATNADISTENRSSSSTFTDAISHRYIDCTIDQNVLYNWSTNLKEGFMEKLKTLRMEISSKMFL